MSNPINRLTAALSSRYTIERELGAGGMATVYLAHDVKHDRKVAIKVLRPELAAVLGAERFVQEIKTTAGLQHPHILPLHDSGEANGFLYYVMPYIEGETLRDKLNRETQLGIDEAVKITTDVADALDYAHRQSVIHRDIKPENILLHDGRPMVADFGIALAISAAAGNRMTETGLSLGTPHYMSPEQATADKDLTNRSDIYSLGAMLYEMLTGSPPHVGSSAQQIIMKIVTEEAAPVTDTRKSVPPNVAAAVAKALEKLPADRFTSAKGFAAALTDTSFARANGSRAAVRHPPVRTWMAATVVLGAVAVVLATTTAWLAAGSDDATQSIVKLRVTFPEGQELVASQGARRLRLSHDGRVMVYSGRSGEGFTQLWTRRFEHVDASPIPGTTNAFEAHALSPDGGQLAFMTGYPGDLLTTPIRGGDPTIIVSGVAYARGLHWGHDEFLYYTDTSWALNRIPSNGGAPERLTTPEQPRTQHRRAFLLPDARGLLFTINPVDNITADTIAVLEFETGVIRRLTPGSWARYSPTGHLVYGTGDGAVLAAPFDARRRVLNGPGVKVLDDVEADALDFSRDGTLVYAVQSARDAELVWVDRAGNASQLDRTWRADFESLAMSSDHTKIAVAVDGEDQSVWVRDLVSGNSSRIVFGSRVNNRPVWASRDRSIVFISSRDGLRKPYEVPADGSRAPRLLHSAEVDINEIVVTPDDRHMIYRTGSGTGFDLHAVARSGGEPFVVTATDAEEYAPAVSPDGRWLAYVSNESGRSEVWVRPFPPTGDERWQVSEGGGEVPRWSHEGTELFYASGGNFVAAQLTFTPAYRVVSREPLFSIEPYDIGEGRAEYAVSADGRRFLFIRRGRGQIVWVQGWFTELRRILAGEE